MARVFSEEFQSLIGRLKTEFDGETIYIRKLFQSLIGRLKTVELPGASPEAYLFQSLIGRLKTNLNL